jgi:hypothetical protein
VKPAALTVFRRYSSTINHTLSVTGNLFQVRFDLGRDGRGAPMRGCQGGVGKLAAMVLRIPSPRCGEGGAKRRMGCGKQVYVD